MADIKTKSFENSASLKENLHKGKHRRRVEDVTTVLSWFNIILIYLAYTVILSFAAFREILSSIGLFFGVIKDVYAVPPGYAPLLKGIERVWLHRVYRRIRDTFERPICSAPGPWFDVMERKSNDENFTFQFTGRTSKCLNLGSYNYLGFAENNGPVTNEVAASIKRYGNACASPRMEGGNFDVVEKLEATIADFVGKEAAIVIGMGFATNSTSIPAICGGKGTLIISDALNHNSIVFGSRDSGAKVLVFKHNDIEDLEKVLRGAIIEGQPRTRRPWKKIVIIVEGIYSMEGEACKLPEIIAVKKKYKAYLYVDEAHSIGALGKTGRGVVEHWGCDPKDVDLLMGTFTKAFGSVGGYIAGSKDFIDFLRVTSYGSVYSTAMSPSCAQQALSALNVIMGKDGTDEGKKRIQRLHDNSNFFRETLEKEGFVVFGDTDSPVIPMMIYHVAKLPVFSRHLYARKIAIVIVGFPVTPMLLNRARFCVSASHTREDLQFAVQQIKEMGAMLWMT